MFSIWFRVSGEIMVVGARIETLKGPTASGQPAGKHAKADDSLAGRKGCAIDVAATNRR